MDKERTYGGGRPIPGYSLDVNGRKICDGQIEEYIMELIEGEAFGYGYYKIYKVLRRKHHLIINPKKVYRLCKKLNISNFAVKYSLLSLEKSIIHLDYIPVKMLFYAPFYSYNTLEVLQ